MAIYPTCKMCNGQLGLYSGSIKEYDIYTNTFLPVDLFYQPGNITLKCNFCGALGWSTGWYIDVRGGPGGWRIVYAELRQTSEWE